jgi:hypothetical protein
MNKMDNQTLVAGRYEPRIKRAGRTPSKYYHALGPRKGSPLCGTKAPNGWDPEPGEAVTCPRCKSVLAGTQPQRTPTQRSWDRMKQRCYDPKHKAYANYGGRGIQVCDRWRNDFKAFLADMGERPPGTSLDRHPDPDGSYEPGNCRWATPLQQRHNRTKLK